MEQKKVLRGGINILGTHFLLDFYFFLMTTNFGDESLLVTSILPDKSLYSCPVAYLLKLPQQCGACRFPIIEPETRPSSINTTFNVLFGLFSSCISELKDAFLQVLCFHCKGAWSDHI